MRSAAEPVGGWPPTSDRSSGSRQAQVWGERLPEARRAWDAAAAVSTARTSAAGDFEWARVLAAEAGATDRRAASQPGQPRSNTIGEPDRLAGDHARSQGATVEAADAASTAQAAPAWPAREAPGVSVTSGRRRGLRPAAATPPRVITRADGSTGFKTWTAPEVARFLDRSCEHRYGALWAFILLTGCRRGEAIGVRWQDLDLDRGRAYIHQTIGRVAGNKMTWVPPRRVLDAGRSRWTPIL